MLPPPIWSNGTLKCHEGEPPLNRVFLGARVLNGEADYFVVLLEPPHVHELAEALAKVSEEWLRARYFRAALERLNRTWFAPLRLEQQART